MGGSIEIARRKKWVICGIIRDISTRQIRARVLPGRASTTLPVYSSTQRAGGSRSSIFSHVDQYTLAHKDVYQTSFQALGIRYQANQLGQSKKANVGGKRIPECIWDHEDVILETSRGPGVYVM